MATVGADGERAQARRKSCRVCGVFASQLLPFYDDAAIDLLGKFETSVYQNV